MKAINLKLCSKVSGGIAEVSGTTITVTGASMATVHGLEFDSHGTIKSMSGDVLFNYDPDNSRVCFFNVAYSVSAIEDGYVFEMSDC